MLFLSNSRAVAPLVVLLAGALVTAPALAADPVDDELMGATDSETDTEDLELEDGMEVQVPTTPPSTVERPKLEIEVPLGASSRAVAHFVTEFVTSGVVLNDQDEGTPDHRVHRVRGSYKRGALAISWRVSF